jgi:D-lactate dehydrogenase (cytochrome)
MNTIKAEKPREDAPGAQLARIIEGSQTIAEQFSSYLQDESKLSAGEIQYLAFCETEQHISVFLKSMSEKKIPVCISNGRTGITGGAVPESGALLTVEKMDKILWIKNAGGEMRIRCQAGVILENLNKEILAQQPDYFYPVDVTEMSARIGGTVATNASGERSFKYGSTRKWVRALRVVLSNGDVLEIKRGEVFADGNNRFEIMFAGGTKTTVTVPDYKMPQVKNAAGYFAAPGMDLIDLFIGSEGTLGVITEVEIALAKKPENIMAVIAFFPQESDALNFFFSAKKELKTALVFEYFDRGGLEILRNKRNHEGSSSLVPLFADGGNAAIFLEIEYAEDTLDGISAALETLMSRNNSSMDTALAAFEQKDMLKIRAMRHALPEGINETIAKNKRKYPSIHKISADIAVPEEKLVEMIEFYRANLSPCGLQYTLFGHIGESHLHVNILPKDEEEFRKAKDFHLAFAKKGVELGGTISAEHGVGKIKRPYLEVMYGKEGLKQMAAVKKALDPEGILGRDNIFPESYL